MVQHRPGSRAHATMEYVRAGMMRHALTYTPEMSPILERWQRALAAGRTEEAGTLGGQLQKLSMAARQTMLDRMTPPRDARDARAVRTARQVRKRFTDANQKRSAAADGQRARILVEARRVARREVLSKAALARVVHDRLRQQAAGARVPSIRTIRRVLPALEDL